MSDYNRKHAQIWLPYFKQGDDMENNIEKDENGVVDVKASIVNHIKLLESAINQLQKIHNMIPDMNTCTLHGNTHYIGIEGDERIIKELADNKLVIIEEEDEEENLT